MKGVELVVCCLAFALVVEIRGIPQIHSKVSNLNLASVTVDSGFSIADGVIVDGEGRERVFHGVNVVYKSAPYIPITQEFDGNRSFVERDAALLSSLGLNVVRLGAQWPGVEPQRGSYNATYVDQLKTIVQTCADHGISVFLDAHQDCFSERFCGEGVPLWAARNHTNFPFPLELSAWPVTELGVPSPEDCAKHSWGDYQFTYAGADGYERLYTNQDGLADAFAAQWAHLAEAFKGVPNVIGFELINEPFAGNIFKHPQLLWPGHADKTRLQGFYDKIASAIHSVDPDRLVMFEPCTWSDEFGMPIFDTGFEHAPGGSASANVSVYAFHYYGNVNKGPIENYLKARVGDATRLQTAAFLTETGSGDAPTLDLFDSFKLSWANWEYKSFLPSPDQTPLVPVCTGCGTGLWPNGEYNEDFARGMARTYPQATQGRLVSFSFNATSKDFNMVYNADPTVPAPTAVFLHSQFHYPNGYNVTVESDLHININKTATNYVYLTAEPALAQSRGTGADRHSLVMGGSNLVTVHIVAL